MRYSQLINFGVEGDLYYDTDTETLWTIIEDEEGFIHVYSEDDKSDIQDMYRQDFIDRMIFVEAD